MNKLTVYSLGVILGVVLVISLEIFGGITAPQVFRYYSGDKAKSHVAGNGGNIPDFSFKPVPVNVFDEVDPEWMLTAPDLSPISFGSMRGRVLFLSRWATWCGPCITEMPELAELRERLPSEDVAFMLYTEENEHIVRAFDNEYNLPIYNSIGYIPRYLNVDSLPKTFIIDKKGVVRYVHAGTALWGDKAVVDFMKMLIAE